MRRLTTTEFVQRAVAVHGNRFDYSNTVYTTKRQAVEIRCCVCNSTFSVRAGKHLYDDIGCGVCSGNIKKTTSRFVAEALEVHGEAYDYTKAVYGTRHSEVTIGCRNCGVDFEQEASVHLSGSGCQTCVRARRVRASYKESQWLDALGIPKEARQIHIKGLRYNVDALVGAVVYEFYGEYFHGDPRRYATDAWNAMAKKTMGELYRRTLEREDRLRKFGLEVRFVWEADYENGLPFSPRHPHECLESSKATTNLDRESVAP